MSKTTSLLISAVMVLCVSLCSENPYGPSNSGTSYPPYIDKPDNTTDDQKTVEDTTDDQKTVDDNKDDSKDDTKSTPKDNTNVSCPIPKDSYIKSAYVNMRNTFSEPYQYSLGIENVRKDYSNFTAGVAWLQCVYQECSGKTAGHVDFQYLKYYFVHKDGRQELAASITSDKLYGSEGYANPWYGKEYERFTFNVPDESLGKIPMIPMNEGTTKFVRMYPYKGPEWDKLYHWWTDRAELPSDLDYIIVKAKVRTTGSCWIQIGSDFWLNLRASYTGYGKNAIEVCVGNWHGSNISSDWTIISMSSKK